MTAPTVGKGEATPDAGRRSTGGDSRPSGRAGVSAIVLTYNEERNLPACLDALSDWVERIFVVDSGSTDETVAIARRYGARVVEHPFEHYGAQRNWAIEHLPIETPWTLHVDADERVSLELRDAIVAALEAPPDDVAGYLMSRRTIFMGHWIRHGGHYPAWHLRLMRTGSGRCEDRLYDQHFYVAGAVQKLQGDLIDTLTPDVETFTRRHLRWAALEAEDHEHAVAGEGRIRGRIASGNAIEQRRWLRDWYGRLPLFVRPVLYFLYRYVVRLGFLDGRPGLVFHVLQGFWFRFLVDTLIYERRRGPAGKGRGR